jgi:putative methionine-R-sulfoxide reductase with GAF domain
MLKRIFIVFYTILAGISLYIINAVFSFIIESNTGFELSFYVFKTNDSFLLMSVIVMSLIMGFINLFIFSDDKIELQKVKQTSESDQSISVEENLNLQIKNKYDEKINEISAKILDDIKAESNVDLKFEKALWSLCNSFELSQGLFYKAEKINENTNLTLKSTYAYLGNLEFINRIEIGIGLNGQVAKSGNFVYLKDVPEGYMKIVSGLGEITPDFLIINPLKKNDELVGLVELAGLGNLNSEEVKTIIEMTQKIFATII